MLLKEIENDYDFLLNRNNQNIFKVWAARGLCIYAQMFGGKKYETN